MNEISKQLLLEVNVNTDKLKSEVLQMNTELDKLLNRQKELAASGQKNSKAYQDVAAQVRVAKDAIKENTAQIDSNIKALNLSKGSLQQNQAFLVSLAQQYDRVSKAKGADSEEAKKLNVQIGTLNNTIADQEKKLNKSREVFDFHGKSIAALGSTFDKFTTQAGEEFAPALQGVASGFNAMKSGLSVLKTGFQSVGGAIKATGFGLLVLVLQSVYEYLTHNKTGLKYFHTGLAAIGVVVEKVKKVFENLGEAIFNTILHPADTIKSVWHDISTFIGNQLKPIAKIWHGLTHGDFSEMKQGFSDIGKNMSGIAHGVVNTFKKAKDGMVEIAGEVTTAFKDKYKEEIDKEDKEKVGAGKLHQTHLKQINQTQQATKEANEERIASIARMSQKVLEGYAKEIDDTDAHFKALQDKYKGNKATVEQLEQERVATLIAINKKYQDDDLKRLDGYEKELLTISTQAMQTARQQAITQLEQTYEEKARILDKEVADARQRRAALAGQTSAPALAAMAIEDNIIKRAGDAKSGLNNKLSTDKQKTNRDFDFKEQEEGLQNGIEKSQETGHQSAALKQQLDLLKLRHDAEVKAAEARNRDTTAIDARYAKQKAELEDQLISSKIHAGDRLIDAVLKNTKKDSVAFKAAFAAKKAASIADVIMNTKKSIMASLSAYSGIPFIGQALGIAQAAFMAVQGATSIAEIVKQKPGFARGGQYVSDGRGALLPGYSRSDNTNAYLRSGEAVVVSEAMANPWARNLVSAINVMHGGRDFSVANPGRGYAIGGIFTDGGNANRYYSQPMQDQQQLANTLAYQLINNFPPIYVDVKDVNNQQNILAQTVNRVNL
ncbi:hypothetical protein [Mucilaginibacter sp.]